MKLCTATLALVLALPFVAQAETKENRTWINGRAVTIVTDTTTQAPAACQSAYDSQLDQQGWHDHIYQAVEGDKAFLIFSQRDSNACTAKEVKITLWKAVSREGKTFTEAWIYQVAAQEVNRFLDIELQQVAWQFKTSPIRTS